MTIREMITKSIGKSLSDMEITDIPVVLEHPAIEEQGDYSTNVAMIGIKKVKSGILRLRSGQEWGDEIKNPRQLAEKIVEELNKDEGLKHIVEKIEMAGPGFINFFLTEKALLDELTQISNDKESYGKNKSVEKKIFIEYAHPNTHKEMHIGHMRTLITGEAMARIAEALGSTVFRANYQGDIGPHVAKAIWGINKIMKDEGLSLEKLREWSSKDKAHFLGRGYVQGNMDYEAHKEEIDRINTELYTKTGAFWDLYQETRQWSLDYYDEFYTRFYTKFNRLFFESEMVKCGSEIVKEHLGEVFTENEGAIIFPGENYGLHTRVFITQAGNPTYEGKEMCNAFKEYEAFAFDEKVHVVASEQAGYFQVVFKALELIDSAKFKRKQKHISMGMVNLKDRKISSRTGDVLTVDWLIDEVKKRIEEMFQEGKLAVESRELVAEEITIGAIKYSVLHVGTGQNVSFDIEKSVSLDGDSGPYLQYTHARAKSVLRQAGKWKVESGKWKLNNEELAVLRWIYRFPEVVEQAAQSYSPNLVCTFLFDLAQRYNRFYHEHSILKAEKEEQKEFRLLLTASVAQVLHNGLTLLGIKAPEKM